MGDFKSSAERCLREAGCHNIEWHTGPMRASRNTEIILGSVDGVEAIAKKSTNYDAETARFEFEAYARWAAIAADGKYCVPKPIAACFDQGILVLEYMEGNKVAELLAGALRSKVGTDEDTVSLVRRTGKALAWFHSHDHVECSSADGYVLLYIDFSPSNLIVRSSDQKLSLIDLPEREEYGPREKDLGVALFEFSRLILKMKSISVVRRWSRFRHEFLVGYMEDSGVLLDLSLVHQHEVAHLKRVMTRYLFFWSYNDRIFQAMRAMLFLPLLSVVRFSLVPYYQYRDRRN
jgi:tRNA A-37 threonylcarbamoyl transferase component Bud32